MNLRTRVILAFVVFGLFLAAMVLFEGALLPSLPPDAAAAGLTLDQVFTKADFRYGPQTTRPYYDPLAIDPGQNASASDTRYLMFIDLNGTPMSGNADVRRLGSLKVSYRFTDLSGRAAFHVYGSRRDTGQTRTDRQEGWNRCGFVVAGTAAPGQGMPATEQLTPVSPHEYRAIIANIRGENANDLAAATRRLWFDRAGSGLDALHLTQDPAVPKGQVTETFAQEGTVWITATGGNPSNDLMLMVAVNRAQPDRFALSVTAEFVEA